MTTIRIILLGAILVTAGTMFFLTNALTAEPQLTLEIKQLYLEAYKAAGVGFLVAVLGVSVPQLLPEAHDRFERFKNSRTAYSDAKTAVMYLPETLSELSFAGAIAAVQDAHRKLHLAETYTELRSHLGWHPHPETWLDRNYWELMAMRKALRVSITVWDRDQGSSERLEILESALRKVESVFGRYNEAWATELKKDKRLCEKNIEDALRTWVSEQCLRQTDLRIDAI
jgi:hypothetical protein